MVQYSIENDQVISKGYVEKLGIPYPNINRQEIADQLSNGGFFPFTRCCFSIGDWGIISGLPEVFKMKYPNLQFYVPSPNWIKEVFKNISGWSSSGMPPEDYVKLVFDNNPHVKYFEPKTFSMVYSDHDRCQRFDNEPLAEQIMRYFGFNEYEISTYDSRPNVYFTKEEIELGNEIINTYSKRDGYGCCLFASRLEHLNNCWDRDSRSIQNLIIAIKKDKLHHDMPVFYYSAFPIEESYWADVFNITKYNFINFAEITDCNLRIQWYIKSKARFNVSYQAGFNDTISRYSKHYVATHRIGTGETTMRDMIYFQNDGTVIKYPYIWN